MPTNLSQVSMAQFRIKFEELFWVQLVMASRKQKDAREIQGIPFVRSRDNLLSRFFKEHLPFPLTKAQIDCRLIYADGY